MHPIYLPQPLVTPEWLHEHRNHPDLIILDATIGKIGQGLKETFSHQWIENSRYFDLEGVFSDHTTHLPHMLPSPEAFEAEAQKLGIHASSLLVIYDKWGIYSSPRVWWMFRAMGHQQVAVLNGGLPRWEKLGYTIQAEATKNSSIGDFKSTMNRDLVKTADEVLEVIANENSQIIDARSSGRFHGTEPEPRTHLKGGHMPTAKNLPFDRVLNGEVMLEPEQLAVLFQPLNQENKPMIFSCGSGVTASVLNLAAHVAGYSATSVYDGSWSEWGEGERFPVLKL